MTVTTTEDPCYGEIGTFTVTGQVTQSGNNVIGIVGIAGENVRFTGTLEGNQLTVEGMTSSAAAPEKITIKTTVSADGKSMRGTFVGIVTTTGCSYKGTLTGTKR